MNIEFYALKSIDEVNDTINEKFKYMENLICSFNTD
jgi:hypothetical protein